MFLGFSIPHHHREAVRPAWAPRLPLATSVAPPALLGQRTTIFICPSPVFRTRCAAHNEARASSRHQTESERAADAEEKKATEEEKKSADLWCSRLEPRKCSLRSESALALYSWLLQWQRSFVPVISPHELPRLHTCALVSRFFSLPTAAPSSVQLAAEVAAELRPRCPSSRPLSSALASSSVHLVTGVAAGKLFQPVASSSGFSSVQLVAVVAQRSFLIVVFPVVISPKGLLQGASADSEQKLSAHPACTSSRAFIFSRLPLSAAGRCGSNAASSHSSSVHSG